MRAERDQLGERQLPPGVYYGVHTLRALENFPLTGIPLGAHPELVCSLARVKQAAARANRDLGVLDPVKADAIDRACAEIAGGRLHDQFVVDVFQGGAGTSSHMNANEVIANRALELLGLPMGSYDHIHPNDDVNRSQSTNDVYPTALKVALHGSAGSLRSAMGVLEDAFAHQQERQKGLVKLGRTQLQDAVPMTLGQEFGTFAKTVRDDARSLTHASDALCDVVLGGTAIGTGLAADPRFGPAVMVHLGALVEVPIRSASDPIEATQSVGAFIQLSSSLRQIALRLSKICNDLRLLASGPHAGLGEIRLPALQAGSSIMPGKVNPVLPEAVNQVCFDVIGSDAAVTAAAHAGQLQLNAFEPLIGHHLLTSMSRLNAACRLLASRCVQGIEADAQRMGDYAERSPALATALNPLLGYKATTELARECLVTGRSVRDLARESGALPDPELAGLLDLLGMTRSGS
ncbi:aspartate ammonia-lyase [Streptomyces sp. NPDC058623]|uniref:aspartate ammonia-lyase n=1 Tax=Streptomyces sp. NPDC058623 TaxID=3346563 RepID=UPI00365D0549